MEQNLFLLLLYYRTHVKYVFVGMLGDLRHLGTTMQIPIRKSEKKF